MRGVEFEHFLARVFEMLGYQVELTKVSGDQGADLVVTGKGKRIAVQAKGFAGSVGNDAVQEVVASMPCYKCDCCVVVTNSSFTPGAKRQAAPWSCRLIDGAQIPALIEGRIY
jgi:HJR/Mrr/RecB family endonuclease